MSDVDWLLQYVTEYSEFCSKVDEPEDLVTTNAKRMETAVVDLVREATEMRLALKAIAGDIPWPDDDKGFVDLARSFLKRDSFLEVKK